MCHRSLSLWVAIALLLLSASMGVALADSYSYDTLGRIIQVVYADGSVVTYQYDAAGNRTVVSATTP